LKGVTSSRVCTDPLLVTEITRGVEVYDTHEAALGVEHLVTSIQELVERGDLRPQYLVSSFANRVAEWGALKHSPWRASS
jgi:fatty acid-binding protein DegV